MVARLINYFQLFLIMKVITLNIPDSANVDSKEAAMLLAASLYEKGKLSLGQAAEVAGLTKRTFAELLGSYGVSIFNHPATDITKDVKNA
jgi:predicted HTH domain antitoxin